MPAKTLLLQQQLLKATRKAVVTQLKHWLTDQKRHEYVLLEGNGTVFTCIQANPLASSSLYIVTKIPSLLLSFWLQLFCNSFFFFFFGFCSVFFLSFFLAFFSSISFLPSFFLSLCGVVFFWFFFSPFFHFSFFVQRDFPHHLDDVATKTTSTICWRGNFIKPSYRGTWVLIFIS